MVTICYKNEKKKFKIGVSARSTHNENINTSKTNWHIFSELTTKIFLKPTVIFPKIDI